MRLEHAELEHSILLDGATIRDTDGRVEGSLLGRDAIVERGHSTPKALRLAAELVEWCRDRIAHYKCPRRVEFTEALPRHDNGKLYKHQLREQLRTK